MGRPKKQMTVELVDERIKQLSSEIGTLNERIRNKKNEIARLKAQKKKLEQSELIRLIKESGKDYSDLIKILRPEEYVEPEEPKEDDEE